MVSPCMVFIKHLKLKLHRTFQLNKHYSAIFDNFIGHELIYTLDKIKFNFSNFSAWNSCAKLIAIHSFHRNITWNTTTALKFFNNDLQLLKQALYTDQSPWN